MTAGELLALAARHGLALEADHATVDMTGLDSIVLHARDATGTRWIVRCPRRPDVAMAAQHEGRVLALVRDRIGVAVPEWRIHTDEMIAYTRIEGTPAVTHDTGAPVWNQVDPTAPSIAFIDSMARLFTALQSIDTEGAELKLRSVEDCKTRVRDAIERTREALQPRQAQLERWERWLEGPTWRAHTTLVHGDLHPGHLLMTDGVVTGVLDWTEAEITDPGVDLAMFGGCFGRGSLENLVARMEALGARTWDGLVEHAMERWAVMPVLGAAWALEHDSTFALDHARSMLHA